MYTYIYAPKLFVVISFCNLKDQKVLNFCIDPLLQYYYSSLGGGEGASK